jgi:Domain of unknown function (DUF4268)
MLERLRVEHPTWTKSTAASTASWTTLLAGTSTAWYGFTFIGTRALRNELYFGSPDPDANPRAFDLLAELRDRFEHAFGRALDWQLPERRKACRVAEDRPDRPIENVDEWEAYIDWLFDAGARMRRAVQTVGGFGR